MQNFKINSIIKNIFHTQLEVRVSDINYGNHLGHDSLVSLLHEARMRFIKSLGYADELNIDGLRMLVTHLVVNYKSEAFCSDILSINIGIGEITKTSFQFIYQVNLQENKKEIATALTAMIFYDDIKSRVARISEQFLKNIKAE